MFGMRSLPVVLAGELVIEIQRSNAAGLELTGHIEAEIAFRRAAIAKIAEPGFVIARKGRDGSVTAVADRL